jgi:hypothetical protein
MERPVWKARRLQGFCSRRSGEPFGKTERSEIANEVTDANAQCSGNSKQSRQGDMFLAAFDTTEIVRMKIGFFSELFLGQFGTLPLFTDGGTDNSAVIALRWHSGKAQQTGGECSTPLNG